MFLTLSKFAALMLFTNPMDIQVSIEKDVGLRFRPVLFLQTEEAQLLPMYTGEAVHSEDDARSDIEHLLRLIVKEGERSKLEERPYLNLHGPKLDEFYAQKIAWNIREE